MSKFMQINQNDLLKGAVLAILSVILTTLKAIVIDQNSLPTNSDLAHIGMVALTAGLSYLLKNLFTNSSGDLFQKEKANGQSE